MRLPLALAAAALAVAALPATAAAPVPGPGPGYLATDNVEWIATIPLNTDSAGARLHGTRLYVTDDRGLTIYDVSTPELPRPLGFTPLPQSPYIPEEDVDTNGRVLLVGSLGTLNVVDVRDPARPVLTATLDGADDHTVTCVLDCTWAYLNEGGVVDLRDPARPKLVAAQWDTGMPASYAHDVTEVSPGIVVTSSNPMLVLDARRDPARPRLLATGSPGDQRFMHANLWPRGGADRWLLAGGETTGACNGETSGAFMVFDTRDWARTKRLRMADEIRLATGLPTDGDSVYDQYCAHWFTPHPRFRDGGLVAAGWYEHGTRFFSVAGDGQVTEAGWFLPLAGSTSAAYWVSDTVLYAVDYQRGIDILRFTGKPASGWHAGGAARGLTPRALTTSWPRATETPRFVCPAPGA